MRTYKRQKNTVQQIYIKEKLTERIYHGNSIKCVFQIMYYFYETK